MPLKNVLASSRRRSQRNIGSTKNTEMLQSCLDQIDSIVITGGAGFLGRHIVEHVVEKCGDRCLVRVMDIRVPDVKDQVAGVEYVTCDLRNADDVHRVVKGASIVIHTATAAPTGANAYNHQLMKSVNVDGTRHIIEACKAHHVKVLVYTSSASVVFEGKDLYLVDEDTPYASNPLDLYTETKIQGEMLVLDAQCDTLSTCALRPSGIFGEYDQLTVPTIVAKAKAGKTKYIIGNGKNMMDWTYAGNIARAHVLAALALFHQGSHAACAGKAYFITNDEPRPFWGMMGDICEGLGYQRPRIHLPYHVIMIIACFVQYIILPMFKCFGRNIETDFTPFRIAVSATNRTFSCARAKKDLGYVPDVSIDAALQRTFQYFEGLQNAK